MRALTALAGGRLISALLLSLGSMACAPPELHPPADAPLSTHADAKASASDARMEAQLPGAPADSKPDQVGLASWYGQAFAGKKTSSGERFDPKLFTAAHKRLPFGTWVEVRRIDTGRSVRVRINDRGPNGRAAHRIIDLSQRAAEDLDIVRAGVVRVELRVVGGP
jgi:rare lipoprotein A